MSILKTAIRNHFEQIDEHMENELRKIGFVRLKPGQVVMAWDGNAGAYVEVKPE